MECVIVLKRNDDSDRFIKFETNMVATSLLQYLYRETWNIIFNETSDGKFTKEILFHFLRSVRLIWKFKKATYNKSLIKTYKNFTHVFHSLKRLLIHFNYWGKDEDVKIFILKANTNYLINSDQITLNLESI